MSESNKFSSNGKSVEVLQADIAEMKRELLNLRFQKVSGELSNTARFKQVRRNIARAMTFISLQQKSS